ncbi:hypothetical protein MTBUT4_150100 [Magnetospirillum sp. UT-4]|nr:hypothetical protein MTBUT4_150100 [Magnetospirillum sp. UT-4]
MSPNEWLRGVRNILRFSSGDGIAMVQSWL